MRFFKKEMMFETFIFSNTHNMTERLAPTRGVYSKDQLMALCVLFILTDWQLEYEYFWK